MQIKFTKALLEFDYLIMFDLASKITGVCLYDIKKGIPVLTRVIKVVGELELPVAELAKKLDSFFKEIKNLGYDLSKCLISSESAPSQIHGGSSTISTFLALAKAHAILDYYIFTHELNEYDYIGVYPISMKAYYKRLNNLDANFKVEKEHIRNFLIEKFPNMSNITLDESDAIFLAKTLVDVKWNKDIDEKIKEIKKHKKNLKVAHAIQKLDMEINKLEAFKNK